VAARLVTDHRGAAFGRHPAERTGVAADVEHDLTGPEPLRDRRILEGHTGPYGFVEGPRAQKDGLADARSLTRVLLLAPQRGHHCRRAVRTPRPWSVGTPGARIDGGCQAAEGRVAQSLDELGEGGREGPGPPRMELLI